ncbi:MAG: methyltransferase [Cetobacterium sp.]|uniref:class I SAM-dependent methyltransferase n=1 Tax=unclassified Cetobacterium TaxID=2630983 RepID=UPI00163C9F76|nr:methyltransferase [Cetobacterium sp. 2A]MBC2856410.1 methyltransferase [Cetobacterium sp. 2A]
MFSKIVKENIEKELQKHTADKMEIYVYGSEEFYSILNVGCETNFFIQKVVKRFPNSKIDIIDTDIENINKIKEITLGIKREINYICEDIEEYHIPEKYDLIFSNLALHLISDFHGLLDKFYAYLNYGGKIVFSSICEKVYSHNFLLDDILIQKFSSVNEIKKIVKNKFRVLIVDEEILKEQKDISIDIVYFVLEKI